MSEQTDNKKTVIYRTADGKDLFFTFLPPAKKLYDKAPVYFMIPGGGWHVADQIGMFNFMHASAKKLSENGFFVASISYRLADDGYRIDEIIGDCFYGLKYLCDNADTFGVDIKKIYVTGHSAGGHLALMLSYASAGDFDVDIKDDYKIVGVAALSPLTVLYDYECKYPNLVGFDTGYLFEDSGADSPERRKSSPIDCVGANTPPTMLFAGTDDTLVYCYSSVVLYEKLKQYGLPAELVLSENGGHCFEEMKEGVKVSVTFYQVQIMTADFGIKLCNS
ncbi:MAG: alpha/beta hydrolase [Clostridia bacterium]|nr:alpha/beta hydrolase [Clostridia bacterium]